MDARFQVVEHGREALLVDTCEAPARVIARLDDTAVALATADLLNRSTDLFERRIDDHRGPF